MERPADINTKICLKILAAWKHIKASIDDFAASRSLTSQQIFVLYSLYAEDHVLMGTLAKHLHCDASNVTWMVDRLTAAGLIERQELPADRRAKQLTITTKGRALIDDLLPTLPQNLATQQLTADESETLVELLDKLLS